MLCISIWKTDSFIILNIIYYLLDKDIGGSTSGTGDGKLWYLYDISDTLLE